MRVLAVWVPDWPVLAAMTVAGLGADHPAAILEANHITIASEPARSAGVRRGMNRRAARELCPSLELLSTDEQRDSRLFEQVAVAVEEVIAEIEICRPGLIIAPVTGASRFHGSEALLAEQVSVAVVDRTGYECHVGIADGLLAAVLAAREQTIITTGRSPNYLAPRALGDIGHAAMTGERVRQVRELVDLWDRLGIRTMHDLGALPRVDIEARFGRTGSWVHRLVHGEDLRPPARNRTDDDARVETELDPPAYRIDVAAFAARRLAEQLHALLMERSAGCERLHISARTESGRELTRVWRMDDGALGGLSAARMTDRVRWQLEGWLTATELEHGGFQDAVPDPLTRLALTARGLVPIGAHQGRIWGQDNGTRLRANRACERVQGLLGVDAVLSVRLQGGRGLRDQVQFVPWGEEAEIERDPNAPWPGRLPEPAPATVLPDPEPIDILDNARQPVLIDRRLHISSAPAVLRSTTRGTSRISTWAGPWPIVQRWWRQEAERSVYLQAVLVNGEALLLSCSGGHWFLEACYD